MIHRTLVLSLAGALSVSGLLSAQTPGAPAPAAEQAPPAAYEGAVKSNASYLLGFQAGFGLRQMLSRQGMASLSMSDIEKEALVKGLVESLDSKEPSIKQEDGFKAIESLQVVLQGREAAEAAANGKAGEAFLAENAKKEGVKTTESGLQYKILTEGTGEKYEGPKDGAPDFNTQFKVRYTGKLIDGTEFDSSGEQAVTFNLQVVPGFAEALKMMPVGSKWEIYLKPDLAYGEQRAGGKIGPNSTLVFQLELMAIEKPAPQPEGGINPAELSGEKAPAPAPTPTPEPAAEPKK